MPLLLPGKINPPLWQFNGHLQTIFPALTRSFNLPKPERERINTPDSDFLDLDWYRKGAKHLTILTHGLEGSSTSPYLMGMAQAALYAGNDVLAWNFRGCSGEPNKQLRFYHSGATEDLHTIVLHAIKTGLYAQITLIGFSLGGNLTLKYAGELGISLFPESGQVSEKIRQVIVFSVPVDLGASSDYLERPANFIYKHRFLKSLKNKIRLKSALYPGSLDLQKLESVKTIRAFDEHFTAPLHGFNGANDYYAKNSSINFIKSVKLPTWLVNARNDVFLPNACFPEAEAKASEYVNLVIPEQGGHCGFALNNGLYWSEECVKVRLGMIDKFH